MKVSLHKLFVEIHFIKVAVGLKDNVHVVQTCNLRPIISAEWTARGRSNPRSCDHGSDEAACCGYLNLIGGRGGDEPEDTHLISRRHLFVNIRYRSQIKRGIKIICSQTHLGIDVSNLLDRASLTGPAMPSGNYTSVRSLAEFLHELILCIYDKAGI